MRINADEEPHDDRDGLKKSVVSEGYLLASNLSHSGTRQAKKREGYMIGGLVTSALELGSWLFLNAIADSKRAVGLVGLIPTLIGIALLIVAFLLVPKKAA